MTKRLLFAIALVCCLNCHAANMRTGKVVYEDTRPVPGAVVYMLDGKERLDVMNNNVMVSAHVPRALTDENGQFTLDCGAKANFLIFARDLEDQCTLMSVFLDSSGFGDVVIQRPGRIMGRLLKGDQPVAKQRVTATYYEGGGALNYCHRSVTDTSGRFDFDCMMPGKYIVQVEQEVPQVGCCFRSVITRQMPVRINPGQEREIDLGGTDLPYLHGKITDAEGKSLHGVWVRLESEQEKEPVASTASAPKVVWSDVTLRDGSYSIYDIPPGKYRMHLFRRLALNDYGLTFQAQRDVVIDQPKMKEGKPLPRTENVFDLSIDLEPFKPLEYEKPAPEITAVFVDGKDFRLSDYKGRVVILYFYASWCTACGKSSSFFNEIIDNYKPDNVVVVGINLDEKVEDCRAYIKEKELRYPQVYAGPWEQSKIRKDYRVINVPTTFVIDRKGKISQIDLFGPTLELYLKELIQSD